MTKQNQTIITIIAAVVVVVGALVAGPWLSAMFEGDNGSHGDSHMNSNNERGSYVQTNSADYKKYSALKGDAYDSAFISNMIVHHEGAVTMAEAALVSAQRQEIKDMAQAIIAAQTKEIAEMKQWQQDWGYETESASHAGGHDSMGDDMASMEAELASKTGNAFDEAFLEQMIMHHQGAINMAAPGEANAKHEEVKTLTRAVVEAQSKEIAQMQEWQKEWGF